MTRPLLYDITRLVTRIFARTPNGIDRVDYAFATHALSGAPNRAALMMTPWGPRVIPGPAAREALRNIRKHWGEDEDPDRSRPYRAIVSALTQTSPGAALVSARRRGQYADALAWIRRHGLPLRETPARFLRTDGIYFNVSQFPLGVNAAFRWLDRTQGVRSVFFIHDLLPLQAPEFFRAAERPRHERRLRSLARYGDGAIVSTGLTRQALLMELSARGRADMPVFVAPLPVDPAFGPDRADTEDGDVHPYFVMIGTIEPRKNHLMILHVWREIVEAYGVKAPKLVLVGERGWENEQVMDLIDRCPALKRHVILASGLATPAVRRLVGRARAVLAPSFEEGYGLPVVEGLAAGAPVIASDIPIFREIAGSGATFVDPLDGQGWRIAIREAWLGTSASRAPTRQSSAQNDRSLFLRVEAFFDQL